MEKEYIERGILLGQCQRLVELAVSKLKGIPKDNIWFTVYSTQRDERSDMCSLIRNAPAVNVLTIEQCVDLIPGIKEFDLLKVPKLGTQVFIVGSKYRAGGNEYWVNTGKFRYSDIEKLGKTVFLSENDAYEKIKNQIATDPGAWCTGLRR